MHYLNLKKIVIRLLCFLSIYLPITSIQAEQKIPSFKPITTELSHKQVKAGDTVYAYLSLNLPKEWHTYGKNPGEVGLPMTLTWTPHTGITPKEILWQPDETFTSAGITSYGYKDTVIFKVPIHISASSNIGSQTLTGTASYLVCSETCIPKKDPIKVVINIAPTSILNENHATLENSFQKKHTPPSFLKSLKLLFAAFVGGLILNIMPCVFPILSLKALSLLTTSANPSQRIKEGWLYTLGVTLAMVSLGAVAILLKHLGKQIGWGFHLQSPVIVTILIWLMTVLGLYFLGVLQLPEWLAKSASHAATKEFQWKQKSSSFSHIITGLLAVFVAAPCTAPFMATTLGVALLQPSILSLEIFLALGLGLASPYLILCYSPALQKRLPKPGAWMKTMEKILSIPMLLTAIWLASVLFKQTSKTALILVFLGIVSLFVLSRLQRYFNNSTSQSKRLLTLLAIVSLIIILIRINGIKPQEKISIPAYAQPYSASVFKTLKEQNKPILLDVTAAWCITCEVNRKTVIESNDIQELIKNKKITVLVADWTDYNSEITELLHTYKRSGVPLVVYINEEGKETILPQILRKSDIIKELKHQ